MCELPGSLFINCGVVGEGWTETIIVDELFSVVVGLADRLIFYSD
jgi:predicted ATP-dependent endonuclease of OLD family